MEINREEILALYDGLRVTDVNDGLDAVGLQNICIMNRDIRPLWRDIEDFKHKICGFAVTVRFVPANFALKADSLEDYRAQKDHWYFNLANDVKWRPDLQKGDVVAIDGFTNTDVGFIGSENAQWWVNDGAVGIVTNGGCRDTDELIKQQIPVYSSYIGRGIRPGRVLMQEVNVPMNIGGVLVRPGDLIVADGDGVVVVPIEKVYEVAAVAKEIQNRDKQARRKLFEDAGKELDFTVQ